MIYEINKFLFDFFFIKMFKWVYNILNKIQDQKINFIKK